MKEEEYNKRIIVGLLVVSIILLGLLPVATAAPQTTVSIPDASANTSETVTVPISMTNVTNLGAATIWLSYDNSVVIAESVSDGDLGSIIAGIDNTAGMTKMSWFSATGMTGDFVFAYVTLNATGSADETSELNLTVKKLVDTGNNPIAHTVDEGMFRASGLQPTPTLTPSSTVSPTLTSMPEGTLTPSPSPAPASPTPPVEETPAPTATPLTSTPVTTTPIPVPATPTPEEPGFEAVFVIVGLLAIAYWVLRGKK